MSRRFGRNQKRKMREAVTAANMKSGYWQKCAAESAQVSRSNRDALMEVTRSLPQFTALLPPCVLDGISPQLAYLQMATSNSTTWFRPYDVKSIAGAICTVIDAPILRSSLTFNPFQNTLHAIVSYNGREWGYAITEQAMKRKDPDDLLRHISTVIASQLIKDIREIK